MNKTTRLLFFFLFFTGLQLIAQSQPQIEMADDFRGEGKMENVIRSDSSGIIKKILCNDGDSLASDQTILEFS